MSATAAQIRAAQVRAAERAAVAADRDARALAYAAAHPVTDEERACLPVIRFDVT